MLRRLLMALACVLPFVPVAESHAQSAADSAAIRQTALNYIEGWYSADADRMASALHPELAKRIVRSAQSSSRLDNMTATQLVGATRSRPRPSDGRKDIRILGIFGNAASVRLDAQDFIDFMHIARIDGEWKIVNVLWELRQ